MKVLFLTIAYPLHGERNLYSDLMQEFVLQGHDVFVLCSSERRCQKPDEIGIEQGVTVLRIKTGNLTKTHWFEKGLATVLLEYQYIQAIQRYFSEVRFDVLLYSTPPITLVKPIQFLKKRDCCLTYLLLKDIFPQNAVDMGYLQTSGLLHWFFRRKEKKLYAISDRIGCMSAANVRYLIDHNSEITKAKVEVCPNSIKPHTITIAEQERTRFLASFGISERAVVFLYGGNLGKPQGLDFFLEILDHLQGRQDLFFLIVGSGTEYDRIQKHLTSKERSNAKLIATLPQSEYERVACCADVGLIFLDPRFTIPNFPSRLTSYMEANLPVLAATDVVSDIKDCLEQSGCGLWLKNGDVQGFMAAVDRLAAEKELRTRMGCLGRKYLEQNFHVQNSVEIIMRHCT